MATDKPFVICKLIFFMCDSWNIMRDCKYLSGQIVMIWALTSHTLQRHFCHLPTPWPFLLLPCDLTAKLGTNPFHSCFSLKYLPPYESKTAPRPFYFCVWFFFCLVLKHMSLVLKNKFKIGSTLLSLWNHGLKFEHLKLSLKSRNFWADINVPLFPINALIFV